MERVLIADISAASAERFTKRICFQDAHALVFVLTFSSGQALPPHRHPGSSVVIHVEEGTGTIVVDGAESGCARGETVLLRGDEELAVRNTGAADLVLLVCLSPNPTNRAYAKELG